MGSGRKVMLTVPPCMWNIGATLVANVIDVFVCAYCWVEAWNGVCVWRWNAGGVKIERKSSSGKESPSHNIDELLFWAASALLGFNPWSWVCGSSIKSKSKLSSKEMWSGAVLLCWVFLGNSSNTSLLLLLLKSPGKKFLYASWKWSSFYIASQVSSWEYKSKAIFFLVIVCFHMPK